MKHVSYLTIHHPTKRVHVDFYEQPHLCSVFRKNVAILLAGVYVQRSCRQMAGALCGGLGGGGAAGDASPRSPSTFLARTKAENVDLCLAIGSPSAATPTQSFFLIKV